MTLCAGVCSYEGRGGLCSVRLSSPLLKLRPRRDLVQTLLHEMIHAYLFVTANNKDHDAHGPNFLEHMHRINHITGAKITVYHSFHNEVNEYRQHWWRCTGPCRNRPPYYGFVKRAMNRAPSPQDQWWAKHETSCGGKYIKVKEPEGYKKKKTSDASAASSTSRVTEGKIKAVGKKDSNIKDFFNNGSQRGDVGKVSEHSKSLSSSQAASSSQGHVLGSSGGAKAPPPRSPDSLRNRLAAAAEKRLKEDAGRGRGDTATRKAGRAVKSGGTRSFSRGKQSHQQADTASGTSSPSCAVDDCIVLDTVTPIASLSTTCSSTVIDLEDSPASSHRAASTRTSGSRDAAAGSRGTIIDLEGSQSSSSHSAATSSHADWDSLTPGLKMCPVCGRRDIPATIINTHITACLEEDSLDTFFED
eukprot:Em0019g150a